MRRWRVVSQSIMSIGYDALCAVLEVESFINGKGIITQYMDVPEEIWYAFKDSASMEMYLNRNIVGKYRERNLFL